MQSRGESRNHFKFGTFIGCSSSDGAASVAVKGLMCSQARAPCPLYGVIRQKRETAPTCFKDLYRLIIRSYICPTSYRFGKDREKFHFMCRWLEDKLHKTY